MKNDAGPAALPSEFSAGPNGYPLAVTLWSDNGSAIRHNTFADGSIGSGSGSGTLAEVTGNLYRLLGTGLGNLIGTPTYTGGSKPTTYAGASCIRRTIRPIA